MTVRPVSTVQRWILRSPPPEIPSNACVCVDMEEHEEESRKNPEPTELESPSAGTGIETRGQQCPPNGETGRTTTDGYLLVDTGSNQGGDISSPTERVGTRAGKTTTTTSAASNIIFLRQGRKPSDKISSEENKQFDPGGNLIPEGKERSHRLGTRLWWYCFVSWGELWTMGSPLLVLHVLCLCVPVCLFCILFFQLIIMFSELKNIRGHADQVADVRNRRVNISLPINPLKTAKINNTRFGCIGNPWDRFDLVQFPCDALFPRRHFMLNLRPGTLTSIHRDGQEQKILNL